MVYVLSAVKEDSRQAEQIHSRRTDRLKREKGRFERKFESKDCK